MVVPSARAARYDAYPRADSSTITAKALSSRPFPQPSRFDLGTPFLGNRLRQCADTLSPLGQKVDISGRRA